MDIDPVDNIVNYKVGIIYWNPADSRLIVPKRERSMGYTLNFAHRLNILILVVITALVIYTAMYLQ
ncbi:DUF5808 domain-containing protein [Pedobacter sp. FW305-3-2-15-E-R2A2]|jgi:uncharacterized membrane protein|uniref:DUF5808 domain-containing protein n=1 Tax=Pedobacter sp. FW305-3-2-15-E-R2A2 TaxID=3140251 RepID=UPI00313FF169